MDQGVTKIINRFDRFIVFVALTLVGCASVPEEPDFACVAEQVHDRSGMTADWHVGLCQNPQLKEKINNLAKQKLTPSSAIQIALLNNPGLQAKYSELGVAQADLVQAGLLANPSLEGIFLFPEKGGSVNLEFDFVFNFLSLLTLPLKQAVAESEFAEAQLRMIKWTLDLANQTRMAFFLAQAAGQLKEKASQIVRSTQAMYGAANALRNAGNISALAVDVEQSQYEEAKTDLIQLETKALQSYQNLVLLLGFSEKQCPLKFQKALPDLPKNDCVTDNLLNKAIEASLDLALIRQRIETLCQRYRIKNFTALIPDLNIGTRSERNSGVWENGPILEFAIPIFDQGQPAIAKIMFQIRGLQEEYAYTLLRIRSKARILKEQISQIRKRINAMQNVNLPLLGRVVAQTQLHYNAMQIGVFDLVKAKQKQLEGEQKYIESMRDYWLVRSAIEQLLAGSLPGEMIQGRQSDDNG
jgi:cobalt-zinc-cadmium efflux system outer membrane protein